MCAKRIEREEREREQERERESAREREREVRERETESERERGKEEIHKTLFKARLCRASRSAAVTILLITSPPAFRALKNINIGSHKTLILKV